MKSALIGRKHGSEEWQLIAGPNISTSDQIAIRAEISKDHPVNDIWEEVIHWGENPIKGKLKFVNEKQSKDAEAAQKLADAALESSRHEAEERQAEFDKKKTDDAAKKHADEVEKLNKKHAAASALLDPIAKTQIAIRAAGKI
jgi:hypothetical protein